MINPNTELLVSRYQEVSPLEFYRDLFPVGELDQRDSFTEGKYNAIAVKITGRRRAERYTICDDLEPIDQLVSGNDFVIISPVSYAGKAQRQRNARNLYALAFDLDGLIVKDGDPVGLKNLIHQFGVADPAFHPTPTYIVSSGGGVHLYYLLMKPIPLFKNVLDQLYEYRRYFTKRVWNRYVTTLSRDPQFESVTQGFRAVGSIAKDGKQRVRAFKVGYRVTIEDLNRLCIDESAKIKSFAYKSDLTLAQAKEKYPDWYHERIELKRPASVWTVKRDLYDWWLRRIKLEASIGHRYFCIMCLAIYAQKCGISREELEKDAFGLIDLMDSQSPADGSNNFDEGDVIKALDAFDSSYITFPRDSISLLSGIEIIPNKRNGRKRPVHVALMNAHREVLINTGDESAKGGRPSKRDQILECAADHPDWSHSRIAKELGVSRTTVIKWLRDNQE